MAASELDAAQLVLHGGVRFCGEGWRFQPIAQLALAWRLPVLELLDIIRRVAVPVWFEPKSTPTWSFACDSEVPWQRLQPTSVLCPPPLPDAPRVVLAWPMELYKLELEGCIVVDRVHSSAEPQFWRGTLARPQDLTIEDLLLDELGALCLAPAALDRAKSLRESPATAPKSAARRPRKDAIEERYNKADALIIGALASVLVDQDNGKFVKPSGVNMSAIVAAMTDVLPKQMRPGFIRGHRTARDRINAALAGLGRPSTDDDATDTGAQPVAKSIDS